MTPAGSKVNKQADTAALLGFANALKQVESKVRLVPYTAQACIELHAKLASLEVSLAALTRKVQEQETASAARPSSTSSIKRGRLVVPAVILLGLGLGAGFVISHQIFFGDSPPVAGQQLRSASRTGGPLSGAQGGGDRVLGLQLLGSSAVSTQPATALYGDPSPTHAHNPDAASPPGRATEPASSAAPAYPAVQPAANASVTVQSPPHPAAHPIPAVDPVASQPDPAGEGPDTGPRQVEAASPMSGGSKTTSEQMPPATPTLASEQSSSPQDPPAPAPPVPAQTIVSGAPATPDVPAANSPATQAARTDATSSGGKIVIQATADAWIEVRGGDGRQIFNRVLHKDDSWVAPDKPGLVLTTGNAGGIEILVDGVVMPALGRSGDVRKNVSLSVDSLRGRPEGL